MKKQKIIVRGDSKTPMFVAKMFILNPDGTAEATSFEEFGTTAYSAIGNLVLGPLDGIPSLRRFLSKINPDATPEAVAMELLATAGKDGGCIIGIDINTMENWPSEPPWFKEAPPVGF